MFKTFQLFWKLWMFTTSSRRRGLRGKIFLNPYRMIRCNQSKSYWLCASVDNEFQASKIFCSNHFELNLCVIFRFLFFYSLFHRLYLVSILFAWRAREFITGWEVWIIHYGSCLHQFNYFWLLDSKINPAQRLSLRKWF